MIVDMTLLMVIAGLCSLVFAKIKMPPILGYLTAGIILGPTMFPQLWVEQTTVMVLSNIGIVLLMFWIGLEQSAAKLKRIGSRLILIVTLEMTMMVIIGYLVGTALGFDTVKSIFLGAILSGTSTAVVVSVLHGRKVIDGEQASIIIGITVFEDVGQVIILTLAAPLLAGDAPALGSTINMIIGLAIFFGLTIMLGMAVIPRVMDHLGKRYPSEILFVIAVGMCFTLALISSSLGLSIAIGAFLMGLIISLSLYSDDIMSKVVPVKELFMAVFFISIGLQIDPRMIFDNIWLVLIIAFVFMAAKTVSVGLTTYLFGHSARDSVIVATGLLAMGEFAFIISKVALDAGVLTPQLYSSVIGAALLTMVALPLISKTGDRPFRLLVRLVPKRVRPALARIDAVKSAASIRSSATAKDRKKLSRELTFIFLDYLVIVLILLMFNLLSQIDQAAGSVADFLGVLPEAVILFFMILAITPAVVHIYVHLKRISSSLTDMALKNANYAEGSRNHIYHVFIDIGRIAMFTLIVLLISPFVPPTLRDSPWMFMAVVVIAVVVAYLARDALHNTYDRFFGMVTGSSHSETLKEQKKE